MQICDEPDDAHVHPPDARAAEARAAVGFAATRRAPLREGPLTPGASGTLGVKKNLKFAGYCGDPSHLCTPPPLGRPSASPPLFRDGIDHPKFGPKTA
jgi:hypothetical protein